MSNLKVTMHRFLNSGSSKSRKDMIARLKHIAAGGGGRLWNNPCVKFLNERLILMTEILARQCNMVGAQRVRRTTQMFSFYKNLYGENPAVRLMRRIGDILRRKDGKLGVLLGAAIFNWEDKRVSDKDILRVTEDLKTFHETDSRRKEAKFQDDRGEEWERVYDSPTFKLWRSAVPDSPLYKYKVFGSYNDIPAQAFYNIQTNLDYRKKWDSYLIRLETVELDQSTGSEVIYWATHFPLGFLYSRDYLFVRRCQVDRQRKLMVLTAESVQHPYFPETKEHVRVGEYMSQMLIRPHKTFSENGFDYVMTYYDNPHLSVPSWAVNKMTMSSLPAFIDTLHEAAKKLHEATTDQKEKLTETGGPDNLLFSSSQQSESY